MIYLFANLENRFINLLFENKIDLILSESIIFSYLNFEVQKFSNFDFI